MGFYVDRILPRITDVALSGKDFAKLRAQVCDGLSGEVLEVGFGSGRNVPHYPPAVERVHAVDPATVGRQLAVKRLATTSVPVEFIGLNGEDLPLEDASVDHVLTTWTLCTIPDVDRALAEMRRVLRPGGALHFVEHGLSPDAKVARWQDRLNPIQKRVFGGCHLNRPIDRLLESAGLRVAPLETFYAKGPKPFGYLFEGVATKA
jgi:ubiquinone/menaquinone biosynthesis C-methylase UbiE